MGGQARVGTLMGQKARAPMEAPMKVKPFGDGTWRRTGLFQGGLPSEIVKRRASETYGEKKIGPPTRSHGANILRLATREIPAILWG